jgi:MFS family permease
MTRISRDADAAAAFSLEHGSVEQVEIQNSAASFNRSADSGPLTERPRANRESKPPLTPGTASSAWSYLHFRRIFIGNFASGIGTWMQNVVIGPYALALTKTATNPRGSASFVGTIAIAQFGPVLTLAVLGGVLANRLPRRKIMLSAQALQFLCAVGLAIMAVTHPSKLALFLGVLGGGIAQALSGPSFQSVIPDLVPREDLPGVIALNSTQLNGARVIGPILMVLLAPLGVRADTPKGMAAAFLINAVTFGFSAFAIATIPIAPVPKRTKDDAQGWRQMLVGVRVAKSNPIAGRLLLMMFGMSALCLPYIGQFATVAERAFHIKSRSGTYTLLYATWALGAMLGGLSMATVLAKMDKRVMVRWMFVGFAVALGAFSQVSIAVLAFPVALVLGFFYFGTTTAMLTVLQQHVSSKDRAPIMALWFMAFGGTIPIGAKLGGYGMDHWSTRGTLVCGAVVALVLAASADLVKRSAMVKPIES